MVVKIYDDKEDKYFDVENVAAVKPYKTFYGDNYFMIKFNGCEEWKKYSRNRYEIDKIVGAKYANRFE